MSISNGYGGHLFFQILKLTLGNTFPLPLLNTNSKINSIDVSADRDKVAIIDDSGTLTIYSLVTKSVCTRVRRVNLV